MNEVATMGSFQNTEMMMADDGRSMITNLTSRAMSYCSFKPTDEEGKAKLFKAMNNPDKRLADSVNEEITVQDVYCEVVEVVDRETGEVNKCPRIVLLDTDGVGYQAVSKGVFGGLCKLFQVYGEPHTWNEPITIKVRQIAKGQNRILTFEVVAKNAKGKK